MIRVLYVVPTLNAGGVEYVIHASALRLKNKGIEVVVACSSGKMCQSLRDAQIKVINIAIHRKNVYHILLNAFKLMRIIQKYKINVVHAHSRAPAWSSYIACKTTSTHFVTTFHSFYGHFLLKKMYSKVMTYGDIVIVPSRALLRHAIDVYGVNPEKMRYVPNWVENSDGNTSKALDDFKKNLQIRDGTKVASVIARITRWKSLNLILQSWTHFRQENCVLIIVGNIVSKRYFKEVVELCLKSGMNNSVKFISGSRESIENVLAISDLLISSSSSKPEGFGLTMLEAASRGVPVVATSHGGALDIVVDGVTGYLFPPNDVSSLTQCIATIFSMSKDEKENMSISAIRHAKNFNPSQSIEKLLSVYMGLIKH
ncbi:MULTISPECIES: glycosyltransferase [unclassified Polynucleobacter]|jgi:glycosyltransferase involved in cell wall biosynthesis|uniref:glycosyltransferase n=1 Tax=unclassified Polynucleobacter TaxID=2640945 RepID=UPI001C0B5498|nr:MULTISPECIES: glycosyltransferase [unclassified Polynucleobacter]MBU3590411.1 glycosyltransferase [Polynucleobacter sp. 78F-HAINBA]MCX7237109.1 glycosyltransferase [Polynucleobacter sp.]